MPLAGTAARSPTMACLKRSRSSAVAMASALAPISSGAPSTPATPSSTSSIARLSAVWPPSVGQQRVGPLALDDLGQHLGGERLDVGAVGEVGVGHDRGRVRVGQDHAVALGPQHAAGLRARVVELAGLTDHDRAAADEQDRLEVGPPRHQAAPASGRAAREVRDPSARSSPGRARRGGPSSGELLEQVAAVVRARAGLGVVLHAEGRGVAEPAGPRTPRR